MSLTGEKEPSNVGKRSGLSKQDDEDLAAIDRSIDRMRANLPNDPYILTIPQDEPRYHHSYMYQTKQWLHHTPFDPREHESSQYLTWQYHEPGREMYMLHNSQPTEAHANGDGKEKNASAMGPNTPSGNQTGAPKKTISLQAYKKKQTGATPEPGAGKEAEQQGKKAALKGPVERIKADEEVLAAVEADPQPVPTGPLNGEKTDLKRKRGDSLIKEDHTADNSKEKAHAEEPERPKKAQRTSPPPREQEQHEDKEPSSAWKTARTKTTAPSKLSPPRSTSASSLPTKMSSPPAASPRSAMPARLSPVNMPLFPPRLPTTIAGNISATQSARAHHRSISRSSEVAGSRSASKDPAARHLTPPPKSVPRNGFRANSSSPAVRSDVEERGRAITSVPRRVQTAEDRGEESDEIAVGKKTELMKRRRDSSSGQSSLVVQLKYGKEKREKVRNLLKREPKPARSSAGESERENVAATGTRRLSKASDARQRDRRDANAKGVAKKVGPASKAERDTPVLDDTEARGGRRGSNTSDLRQREQRDADAKGVAKKVRPAAVTNGIPSKEDTEDGTSTKRKRPRSDDAEDCDESPSQRRKTASGALEVKSRDPSTPVPADLLSPSSAPKQPAQLSPQTMRKDVLSAAMKREQSNDSRINTPPPVSLASPSVTGSVSSQTLNGTTKQPSTKTPKQEAWDAEQKRLEAIGKELKRSASEHSTSNNSSSTSTTSGGNNNSQKLAAIKALESFLAYILAFTCADQAHLAAHPQRNPSAKLWRTLQGYLGFVKRHCEPFPLLLGLACTLGVVFNAHILDLATQNPGEVSVDALLETCAMMRRAANDAEARLDVDGLRSAFPRTWEGRTKGVLPVEGSGGDVRALLNMEGGYKLPLGVQTSPLRAVRAGYGMLREWVEREVGGYEMRLRL